MADQAIEKWNPASVMDGVRDKIKATFVSMIPDAEWDRLIKHEIDDWFAEGRDRDYSSPKYYRSKFSLFCQGILEDIARVKVRQVLETYTTGQWQNGEYIVSEQLRKLIVENAGEMFAKIMGPMMSNVIQQMRQQ